MFPFDDVILLLLISGRIHFCTCINPLRHCDAYTSRKTVQSLIQIVAWPQFGTKPLSMLINRPLQLNGAQWNSKQNTNFSLNDFLFECVYDTSAFLCRHLSCKTDRCIMHFMAFISQWPSCARKNLINLKTQFIHASWVLFPTNRYVRYIYICIYIYVYIYIRLRILI